MLSSEVAFIKKLWTFFGPWGRDRSQSPPCWIFRIKQIHQSTASGRTTRLSLAYNPSYPPWHYLIMPLYNITITINTMHHSYSILQRQGVTFHLLWWRIPWFDGRPFVSTWACNPGSNLGRAGYWSLWLCIAYRPTVLQIFSNAWGVQCCLW